ncbi:endonuclease/exonuclease/phosphatase family protein [Plebeiibacterium sediminum]|uniref:Endonuclease/exonuclease/phosphatase family protein n=1 Tax=Plebeiibacterium sediminum TaxID=2992112 RepID=A0AAE3M5B6_9BACT|nr:endonuclease/exonuclease/phosphatase family protein [Plebeiobacterium sediminum]MCW3787358.1 endonuclease/exonuclease/phosphatase family protein [Plebeiobacterium sediminum]
MNTRIFAIICLLSIVFFQCTNQPAQKRIVAFYNLENLFDTINDPNIRDGEFTPDGSKNWDTEKYNTKINNMSQVIAKLGEDQSLIAPDIIGVCEVENKKVLEDLISSTNLSKFNYQIVHQDSPDKRGIDVALLYKAESFQVIDKKYFPLLIHDIDSGNRIFTRDQLLVKGILNSDTLNIIVNHWPSRYGGTERSIPLRKAAAELNRHIIDSLLNQNIHSKIITMGDLNDNPTDVSVTKYLLKEDENLAQPFKLHNTMADIYKSGKGTLYYKGEWDLFDQIIVSDPLIQSTSGLSLDTAVVFNKPFLFQQDGKYKGYLLRTFGGRTYLKGYSDHLPVYIVLK